MNSRKLRIAWSVVWGVVAVLLSVLWLRSYTTQYTLSVQVTNEALVAASSEAGGLWFAYQLSHEFHWFDFDAYRLSDAEIAESKSSIGPSWI